MIKHFLILASLLIPAYSYAELPHTPEQIEDKKKLDALNRTIRSNKEKRALALKLVKKNKEREKEAMKEAEESLDMKCPLDCTYKAGLTWSETH